MELVLKLEHSEICRILSAINTVKWEFIEEAQKKRIAKIDYNVKIWKDLFEKIEKQLEEQENALKSL